MLKTVIPDKVYLSAPVTNDAVVQLLKDHDIRWVCSVGGFDNSSLLHGGGFRFLVSKFQDNGRDQERGIWQELWDFLAEWQDSGEKLAIHCVGGPRRSVSVAYMLLRQQNLSDAEAIHYLEVVLPHDRPIYSGPINNWLSWKDQPPGVVLGGSRFH